MMAPVFRQLGPEETSLLQRATLGNMNWCGERFMMDDILARPEFSHYVAIRPERGDFGVVAEVEGNPIGVCWAQFLPADDPGYGFIDEQTPEASLWVSSGARGQGWGDVCLRRWSLRRRYGVFAGSACPWNRTTSRSSSTALSDSRMSVAVRMTV